MLLDVLLLLLCRLHLLLLLLLLLLCHLPAAPKSLPAVVLPGLERGC